MLRVVVVGLKQTAVSRSRKKSAISSSLRHATRKRGIKYSAPFVRFSTAAFTGSPASAGDDELPRSGNSILATAVIRRLAGLRHLAGLRKFLRRHGLRHVVQFRLCGGVAAGRGAAEPQERAHRIARDPSPPAVHHPERVLRLRISLFGERPKQPDRRHVVAAVI